MSVVRKAQNAMMEVGKQLEFTERNMKVQENIIKGNWHEVWRKVGSNIKTGLNLTMEGRYHEKQMPRYAVVSKTRSNKESSNHKQVRKDGKNQSLEDCTKFAMKTQSMQTIWKV